MEDKLCGSCGWENGVMLVGLHFSVPVADRGKHDNEARSLSSTWRPSRLSDDDKR